MLNKIESIRSIAKIIDLQVNPEEVIKATDKIKNKPGFVFGNNESLTYLNHITDGGIHTYVNDLTLEEAMAIENKYKRWCWPSR